MKKIILYLSVIILLVFSLTANFSVGLGEAPETDQIYYLYSKVGVIYIVCYSFAFCILYLEKLINYLNERI